MQALKHGPHPTTLGAWHGSVVVEGLRSPSMEFRTGAEPVPGPDAKLSEETANSVMNKYVFMEISLHV